MSMHHRTSTTTTTAATVLEEEVYGDKPVFSRHSKAGDDPLNSTPIPPKSSSSSTSSLPPPYSATPQQAAAPSSLTPSCKPEEQHTKSSSWRFEIALEGGSCVIRQLGHPAAQAAAPTERDGGAMGILSCVKALFSIVAGTVMAFVGVIVSVVAVLVTRVFPSMAARAPETVARSSSDNAIAGSRKRKLSPAPGSSTSSPSIGDRQVLSPSDLSLVGSTSTGLVSSLPTSPLPGIQRHVTFNLEQTKSSATGSVSSGAGKSKDDIVGLNTPTIATFPPPDDDEEKEVSEMGVVVRAATTLSSVPATSSGSKKRKSWFMKRRAATLASTGSDVDDSSDAGTIASMTNSAPPTPSTLVTELPPVSEEDVGSGADAGTKEKKDAAKSGRRISLKLQFGGKSWKRRSGSAFVEGPAASGSGNPEDEVNSEMVEATTPSSAVSSSAVPMPPPSTNPTVTSKQQKRRSFPFVGSSNSTSIPSTAPIRPTARTNPYGAPYFAAPPTARLSYDDAAQSDRESGSGHRRTESADGGSMRSTAVRQDSTGSGFSRASSSLTSGTGSESGLGLRSDAGVSEVGELVVQTPPSSPPPQATSSSSGKKKTSPYSKPRLPSTLPTSPLSSTAFTSSSSAGRVASDSTAVLGSRKNQDRKRTSSSSNRPPVVDRHARMRDAALAWASDSEMASENASIRVRRGSASAAVRGESRLRE